MVLQRSMLNRSGQSAMDICAITCAMFGLVVYKASMPDWRREWGQSAMGICVLCYIHIYIQGIYALLKWCLSARFGVVVF